MILILKIEKLSKLFYLIILYCDDDENRNEINVNFSSIENLIEILIGLTQLDENFKFVQFHGIFWPNDWLAMNHVLVVGVDQLQLSARERNFQVNHFCYVTPPLCVWIWMMHMTSRYHHFLYNIIGCFILWYCKGWTIFFLNIPHKYLIFLHTIPSS